MASAAQMGVAETYDCRVVILVSGAIGINLGLILAIHILWNGVGLGTKLHDTEW